MSNEFVMVPRAVVDRIADHCKFWKEHPYLEAISDIEVGLRAILAKPAEHKGEPVALPAHKQPRPQGDWTSPETYRENLGWNACLDEIAKLGPLYTRPAQGEPVAWQFRHKPKDGEWGPWRECSRRTFEGLAERDFEGMSWEGRQLYTHADPGEVERLRVENEQLREVIKHSDSNIQRQSLRISNQRAQLAELLAAVSEHRKALKPLGLPLGDRLEEAALSASAEPSAPDVKTESPKPVRYEEVDGKTRLYLSYPGFGACEWDIVCMQNTVRVKMVSDDTVLVEMEPERENEKSGFDYREKPYFKTGKDAFLFDAGSLKVKP